MITNPPSEIDEQALVARAIEHPDVFAALYDRYAGRVYGYLRYLGTDSETAKDLTAHTFESALACLDTYRPRRGTFGVWLFTIARNAFTDHLRRHRRHPWLPLDTLYRSPASGPGPEERLLQCEAEAELRAALAKLAERDRDLLGLKFAARLTNRQIAAMTGLSESNVSVILYRAVCRLRRELAQEEHERERA